jgi:prephenate dehydrogenase
MTKNLSELRLTIAGFGLMGGSLAMALRPYAKSIMAIDHDSATLQMALRQGLADTVDTGLSGALNTDLLILATPVRAITDAIQQLPHIFPSGCAVLDLGSTKLKVLEAMDALPSRFDALGGHPMCGREVSGLGAAEATLYTGQTFILCRSSRTSPSLELLALRLVEAIGAKPLFMSAESHDQLVAASSHLPFAASATLLRVASIAAASDERLWRVSSSGLRDTTRLAGSNPEIMLDILLTNRTSILKTLRGYVRALADLVQLIEASDEGALLEWLVDVRTRHKAYLAAIQAAQEEHENKR